MKYMWKAVAAAVLLCSIFELGCGDTFRQIATPILQPAGDPALFDMVVVVQSAGATANGFVQQIEVSGDSNIGEKPIGAGATMGALDPSGSLMFTANTASNDVTAISVSSFAEVTISLPKVQGAGAGPTYIGGTKSGTMYVAVAGRTPDACSLPANAAPNSGYVGVIDSTNLTLVKPICLKDQSSGQEMLNPSFLVQSANTLKVYVLDSTTSQMAIIDAASGTLDKIISVGSQPSFATLSFDQSYLYILNKGSNNISIFRISDQTLLPTTVSTGGTGSGFMLTDTRLNRLYVTNTGSGTISAFDISNPVSPTVIGGGPVTVGPSPMSLTALRDGSRVYVANGGNGTVTELLASNLSTIKTITVNSTAGATTNNIVSSNDSSRVYVTSKDPTNLSNGTTILRTSDDSTVTTIKSPKLGSTCTTGCQLFNPTYVFTKRI